MTTIANPNLLPELQRFGAAEVNACFSCGNCTAICPLVDADTTFPRRFIRLAQVGLEADLVASKELWTCYQCGVCSTRCPMEAEPAEFMATARRFAIAHYDKTGLARLMYRNPVVLWVVAAIGMVFFSLFLGSNSEVRSATSLALFDFVPYEVIHWLGIAVMAVVAGFSVLGGAQLARDMARREGINWREIFSTKDGRGRLGSALWYSIGIESIGQRRFREDCHDDEPQEPLYRRRWLIHALTLWGFIGLFVATGIDYGLDVAGIKATGTPVSLLYPTRLLGTVAGLALMYGVTWFMVNRATEHDTSSRFSKQSDWLFLVLLWGTGFTGFLIEVALYAPPTPDWGYTVFIGHVALAMDLLVLLPFTKFAHIMYRPIALFFQGITK